MVFADSIPVRRTVREKLELSGRNLRDSRYEHPSDVKTLDLCQCKPGTFIFPHFA